MEITRNTPLYITYSGSVPTYIFNDDGERILHGLDPAEIALYFDVVMSISENSEAEISEFPIGFSTVSDHMIIKNKEFTFTASVSNNPHQKNPQTINSVENGFVEAKGWIFEADLKYPENKKDKILIPELQYPSIEQWQTTGNKITNFVSNVNPQTVINAAVPNIGNSESERKHPYKAQPTRSGDQKYLNYPRTQLEEVQPKGWIGAGVTGFSDTLQVGEGFSPTSRSSDVYWILRQLQNEKIPCSLITRDDSYNSMFITSINVEKTPEDGDSLTFNVTMKQINRAYIAEVFTSTDPVIQNSKEEGIKSPTPTPTQETEAMERKHTEAVKLDLNANGIPDSEE